MDISARSSETSTDFQPDYSSRQAGWSGLPGMTPGVGLGSLYRVR